MQNTYIEMAFQEKFDVQRFFKNSYLFKPKSWFDKLLWKILNKRKTLQLDWTDQVAYRKITIDREKACVTILRESQYKIAETYNKKVTKAYMGPEYFSKLMTDPVIVQYGCQLNLTSNLQLFGIEIIVVPYMEGLLLV